MWAEDNPALVLSELTLEESKEQWRQRKGAVWTKTFSKLPIPELKKVLRYTARIFRTHAEFFARSASFLFWGLDSHVLLRVCVFFLNVFFSPSVFRPQ